MNRIVDYLQIIQAVVMGLAAAVGVSLRFVWKTAVIKPLAELKVRQQTLHDRHRQDTERLNVDLGKVAIDVAKHDMRITHVEQRVDRVERQQDDD